MEKMMKAFYRLVVLAAIALLLPGVNARAESEAARRHMDRGQAAVEMAKSPEDFEEAAREFQKAIDLAPNWADPYYSLALVQDKMERFDDAMKNLASYLELVPQANDTAQVKQLINKIDYKKERADRSQAVIRVLTGTGDWKWISGRAYGISDPHSKFRLRDGRLETLVLHAPLLPYQWVPVAYDGKLLQYEFTWYTVNTHQFKASVTLEIKSTSPLRLKAKLVDEQLWGDHTVDEFEYVIEWVDAH
jgi:tetratricopeptide (TPR) repeat protein